MGKTESRFAEFIVDTSIGDIPEPAFRVAREATFDLVGVMLAGASSPHGRTIARFAQREGPGSGTIVGTGLTASTSMAVLANGTLGHALDFDDMGAAHISVVLVPAALALGEALRLPSREVLAAYVIGLEVVARLLAASHYSQHEDGFHSTAVFGTFGAAAVAARLLGLTKEETVMALGTTGSMPAGVIQNFGTPTKPLHAGMAGRNGVVAAQLAKDGWTACDNIFESRFGWAGAYLGREHFDAAAATKTLGDEWATMNTVVTKKYPCCGSMHSALDGLLALMQEHGFTADDVTAVELSNISPASSGLMYLEPRTSLQGKFSMYFTVASALVDGALTHQSFEPSRMSRPEVATAITKIRLNMPSEYEPERPTRFATPVVVTLQDGRVLERTMHRRQIHGGPADPLSQDEQFEKFRANASLTLSKDQIEPAVSAWWRLDEFDDVAAALSTISGR